MRFPKLKDKPILAKHLPPLWYGGPNFITIRRGGLYVPRTGNSNKGRKSGRYYPPPKLYHVTS